MRLYAITDRKRLEPLLPEGAADVERLRSLVAGWIEGGVEFIQLREKDLNAYQLGSLAEEIFAGVDRRQARFLINLPASSAWLTALAPVADGVHVPGCPKPGTAERVRRIFAGCGRDAIVSMVCHSIEDVQLARADGADLALFAPVFEKAASGDAGKAGATAQELPDAAEKYSMLPGQGLEALRRACEAADNLPVFALGGVTAANAAECLAAGAAGVAGIRLFVGDGWRELNAAPRASEEARSIYS